MLRVKNFNTICRHFSQLSRDVAQQCVPRPTYSISRLPMMLYLHH